MYDQRMIELLLVALAIFGVVGFLVLGKTGHDQKKSEDSAPKILDAAFDGRPDVTFKLHMRTLKYETVIAGAKARGYKLVHQADNQYGPHTLMFEKV